MKFDARKYAHDINGALTAILTSAELAAKRATEAGTAQAFERINASARRAAGLVQNLFEAALQAETGPNATYQRDLDYLDGIHPSSDAVLADLEKQGQQDDIPIVDRETGRALAVVARCVRAAYILEIGTAYGYSTLWFANGQPQTGRILTIDPDRNRTDIARRFWERAGVAQRIDVVNQPALALLPSLPREQYDIVFIDALKEEYVQYLEASLPLLKKSGLLMADNLLWHHGAARPAQADDPDTTKTIRRFNDIFLHHPQLLATIIPVGDGLGIGVKISEEKEP